MVQEKKPLRRTGKEKKPEPIAEFSAEELAEAIKNFKPVPRETKGNPK